MIYMKKNKDRYFLILIIIVLIVLILFYVKDALKKENNNNVINVSVTETIESYDYTLKSNKSELYKTKFNELKNLLVTEYLEEDYLKLISEMFIIDFYTLDGKISNTDIGGIDFVYKNIKDNFSLKATETIYKYVENNLYSNHNLEFPIVKEVTVTDIKKITYNFEDKKDSNAYQVIVNWNYEKDLGYETQKTLYFVHEDNKLSLVEIA